MVSRSVNRLVYRLSRLGMASVVAYGCTTGGDPPVPKGAGENTVGADFAWTDTDGAAATLELGLGGGWPMVVEDGTGNTGGAGEPVLAGELGGAAPSEAAGVGGVVVGTTGGQDGGPEVDGNGSGVDGGGGAGGSGSSGLGGAGVGGTSGVGGGTEAKRVMLNAVNGWIDGSTNDVGIQGLWYTFTDGVNSITPADFKSSGTEICVSGRVLPMQTLEEGGVSWGVGFGFSLNRNADSGAESAYDAAAHDVSGFSFTLTGNPPAVLRSSYKVFGSDTDYCTDGTDVTPEVSQTIHISDVQKECWMGGSGSSPSSASLRAFEFIVPADALASRTRDFDFCVTNLHPVSN
jgi:hypothetical protein